MVWRIINTNETVQWALPSKIYRQVGKMRHGHSHQQYWIDEILEERSRSVKCECIIIVLNIHFKDMISNCIVSVVRFWVSTLLLHDFLSRVLEGAWEAMRRIALFLHPAYSFQVQIAPYVIWNHVLCLLLDMESKAPGVLGNGKGARKNTQTNL